MKLKSVYICLILFLVGCSLSASQEQELNRQTGIYLDAKEKNSILMIVAKTHPSFVKYAKTKGDEYFQTTFKEHGLEELIYIDPRIMKIESVDDKIHVLYEIDKEYIKNGENHHDTAKFLAISDDDGLTWYYLNYGVYTNEKICLDIPRLIK